MAVEPGADDARQPGPMEIFRTEGVGCTVEALEVHATLPRFGEDAEGRLERDAAVI